MSDEEAMRAAFEAWAKREGFSVTRDQRGYYFTNTNCVWLGWRAAIAHTQDGGRGDG